MNNQYSKNNMHSIICSMLIFPSLILFPVDLLTIQDRLVRPTCIRVPPPSWFQLLGMLLSSVSCHAPGSFGLWFSILRGQLPRADRDLLAAVHPDHLWISAPQLSGQLLQCTHDQDSSDELVSAILRYHQWPPGADKLWKATRADKTQIRTILAGGGAVPAAHNNKTVATLWFCRRGG